MKKTGFILFGFFIAAFTAGIIFASLQNAFYHRQSSVPSNIDEAIANLETTLPNDTITQIKNMSEEDFVTEAHFGLGMRIRNSWNLWTGTSPMDWYFYRMGIFHPDDMSDIILTSFYRHLNNKPINLNEQIKVYRDYWKNF